MQDKEFDQFFRNILEEGEMEPSKDLWKGIEVRLEPTKKVRLPVFWMAAALTIVLISAGLLLRKTEKIQLQGQGELVEYVAQPQSSSAQSPVASDPSMDQMAYAGTPLVIAPSISVDYTAANAVYIKPEKKRDPEVMLPAEPSAHPHTGAYASAQKGVNGHLEETPIMADAGISDTGGDMPINSNSTVEKKGIRNVGDLVNFVVDKVDKREQKLLKFNTDDDDNSSLVAINIGFIKLNSKQHK